MRHRRRAARVLVIDPDGSTFLFRYDDAEIGRHWAMPGGGLERGESARQAAQRELREETGWTDVDVGPLLWIWEHDFTRFEVPTRQRDEIYLGRGPRRDPEGDLARSHADDEILEWRWWSLTELSATEEPMWPPSLAELVQQLRKAGPPVKPIDLGYVGLSPPSQTTRPVNREDTVRERRGPA